MPDYASEQVIEFFKIYDAFKNCVQLVSVSRDEEVIKETVEVRASDALTKIPACITRQLDGFWLDMEHLKSRGLIDPAKYV